MRKCSQVTSKFSVFWFCCLSALLFLISSMVRSRKFMVLLLRLPNVTFLGSAATEATASSIGDKRHQSVKVSQHFCWNKIANLYLTKRTYRLHMTLVNKSINFMSDRSPPKGLNLYCRGIEMVFKWSFLSPSFMKTAYFVDKWYKSKIIWKSYFKAEIKFSENLSPSLLVGIRLL